MHPFGVSPQNLQSNSLRNVPRACAPHQCILEAVLDTPMNLIANVLDGAVVTNDESLAEVRVDSLTLRVDSDEVQLVPAAVDDFPNAEVELAAHNDCVWFAGKAVEEVQADAVDLVVDV